LRVNSAREIPAFTMNGGAGTLGLNITNHFGLEFEFGGYHNGSISDIQFDTTYFTYLFGPRFSVGRSKKVDPYFHTLFGGVHVTSSIAQTSIPGATATPPASGRYATSQDTFAMAAGGGLDIRLSRHVMFRPIQLDYVLTRLQDLGLSGQPSRNRNQNNLRYAAGIMFTFGGERAATPPPPPIATKDCPGGVTVKIDQDCPKKDINLALNVSKTEVCAGDTVTAAPTAALPEGAAIQWTINSEPVSQAATLDFNTTNRSPGSYRIGMKVTAEGFNDAVAETSLNILEYKPPSGTLRAFPSEIWVGEKSTISANFSPGQCGGSLRPPTFSASEGSVSGADYVTSGVQFDPANNAEQRKTITISAKVADDKGSTAAETSIVVKKKAAIMAKRLPDIVFPTGSDRVNNCGKRVLLEELKANLDNDPTGRVVFVGHQTENESKWPGLDQKRALNAAAVISAGQGICGAFPANQILVSAEGTAQSGADLQPHFCAASAGAEKAGQGVSESDDAAKYRRVEVWFVPTNGVQPPSLRDHKDAATLSVSALGCPK